MKKILCRGLCCVLSLVMLLALCACGEEEEEVVTNPPIAKEDYSAEQSYHLAQNGDGTFNFQVANHIGQTLYLRTELKYEPAFTALNKDLLQVVVKEGNGLTNQWAVFCNVDTGYVSKVFAGFLHANTTHVAYVEFLTGQYHVFVANLESPETDLTAVTLEGLTKDDGQDPITGLEVTEQGDLLVSYRAGKEEKTTAVDMP